MKKKLLVVALLITSAFGAMAQSAFDGVYKFLTMKKIAISICYGFALSIAVFSLQISAQTCGTANTVVAAGQTCTDIPFYTGAGITINNAGIITNLTNNAGIVGNPNNIDSLVNSGTITGAGNTGGGSYDGIHLYGVSQITSLQNSGSIIGALNGYGINMDNNTFITTLTNTGYISGGSGGILNRQSITNLNNAQGGNGASASTTALQFEGNLPTNYNIIIKSSSHYGQLDGTSGVGGSTNFGVNSGLPTVAVYSQVLKGLSSGSISTSSGTYSGLTWSLRQVGVTDNWDLVFSGTNTNTQQSLVNTSQVLQNTFALQNSVLANSFTYDCNLFDVNNICISAGGRNTAISAANGLNNTSGLLIAAYRPHQNYRVGAYVDQNLSVNNAGSTVNLGNNTPLIGLFAAWNERLDGIGTEVKVSAAYGQKNTTITRSIVGSGATASEAGSGSSQLNSQGAQVTAKYGFGVAENVIVSPYAGIRYTQNNMGGYTEGASATVTAPLTYAALNTNATTALAGVGVSYKIVPQVTTFASAGVESDTNTANGSYSATGVTGLTPVNFNANPVKTRPTATLGATYDVEKNQRIGITCIYRQEAYQAVQSTTVMATYTVGL